VIVAFPGRVFSVGGRNFWPFVTKEAFKVAPYSNSTGGNFPSRPGVWPSSFRKPVVMRL
jgi:hypothetical protein